MGRKRVTKSGQRGKKRRRYAVFLSHATYDKWMACALCERIEAVGAIVFRDDRDIEGGEAIPAAIRKAIRDADEVVVLLTPESMKRQWVLIELAMASMAEKRIVPLLNHVDAARIPDIIRDARGFALNDLEAYLADLMKRMERRGHGRRH